MMWAKILQTYAENEERNYHAENALMLAKALGSRWSTVAELETLAAKARRGEGLSSEDVSRRRSLTEGHYREALVRRDAEDGASFMDHLARYWQRNKADPVRILSDAYSCDNGHDLAGWRKRIEAGDIYEREKLKNLQYGGILDWWFTLDSESRERLTLRILKGGA